MLDDGRLTDAKGRVVNFKNTIIIMTSNIGSQFISKMESIGFTNSSASGDYENVKGKVLDALKDQFRPEFLNRIDEIVLFDVLSKEAIREIVTIRTKVVADRLATKGIALELSNEALDFLAATGHDPHYGARPLNRLIQSKILNPVASFIIGSGAGKGDVVRVTVKNNDLVIETKKASKKVKSTVVSRGRKIA